LRTKTENDKQVRRWNRQQTSNEQSAQNDNRTEETQHGPAPVPPNIGITKQQY